MSRASSPPGTSPPTGSAGPGLGDPAEAARWRRDLDRLGPHPAPLRPAPAGDVMTPAELLPLVYDDLRRVAAAKLAGEPAGGTLDATALVHEAWLRLADASVEWQDRGHFFRAAATAMWRVLVDRARAKLTTKRGDGAARVELPDLPAPLPDPELVALDEALTGLARDHPDHARLVELRFFAGLSGDEAAAALGVSPATADRMWRYARAWLQVALAAR